MSTIGGTPPVPSAAVARAVEDALGVRPVEWRKPHTGLTAAERFLVKLEDGSFVFVKAAVDDDTERWLRSDHLVMTSLQEYVPEIVAWTEADGRPVLVMEALHEAHWPADHLRDDGGVRKPVLWKQGQLDLLFEALAVLERTPAPPPLPPLATVHQPQWPLIAETPHVLLDLQVADEAWLDHALPHLLAAEETLDLRGDSLVHNDVRSDNVCFLDDRVVLVDWSDARRGAPGFDLANLLQTLPLEGGPDPFTFLPDAAGFAAWRAGELVRRAAGAYGPAPSWLVKVFKRMAVIDLDWAARCLDLPPRHGVHWTEI